MTQKQVCKAGGICCRCFTDHACSRCSKSEKSMSLQYKTPDVVYISAFGGGAMIVDKYGEKTSVADLGFSKKQQPKYDGQHRAA